MVAIKGAGSKVPPALFSSLEKVGLLVEGFLGFRRASCRAWLVLPLEVSPATTGAGVDPADFARAGEVEGPGNLAIEHAFMFPHADDQVFTVQMPRAGMRDVGVFRFELGARGQ